MSKLIFFNIPAYGHTNPTLPVIRELIQLGHEVYYYSFNTFKKEIEATGATFISCDAVDLGMTENEENSERVSKDIVFATQLIVKATLAMDDWITQEVKRIKPDIIVSDSVAYWGKLLALKLNIPYVSSTTTFAFNQHSSKIMKQSLWNVIKMFFQLSKTKQLLKPLRDKGYKVNTILDIIQNDHKTHTVVYTSKYFQPCADTFSDCYTFVGPCLRQSSHKIKKTRDKLIYISLGTVNNKNERFYQNCIEALKESDYQVIISVGEKVNKKIFEPVPPFIKICSFVDQLAVLKEADVFLSHCGMNSVSESLYYGVPLVLFPQTSEQKGVANRVKQLGAGLYLKENKASTIQKAIQTVLEDTHYKEQAQKIQASFSKCGGAKEAAQAILSVLKN